MVKSAGTTRPASAELAARLRQMIAVLEQERQSLAALDRDGLTEATREKEGLCEAIEPFGAHPLDPETRALAETAKHLNAVNRRVRNLLAANVSARLEALGEQLPAYGAPNRIPA